MGRHSRNLLPTTPGHRAAPIGLRYRHCQSDPEPMPWLLMGEEYDDITEALEYNPWDDDDDGGGHRVPAKR